MQIPPEDDYLHDDGIQAVLRSLWMESEGGRAEKSRSAEGADGLSRESKNKRIYPTPRDELLEYLKRGDSDKIQTWILRFGGQIPTTMDYESFWKGVSEIAVTMPDIEDGLRSEYKQWLRSHGYTIPKRPRKRTVKKHD